MIISFSFLSLLKDDYKKAIIEFNKLSNNDWLHFDVMDGKFVSNTTFDFNLVKEIEKYNKCYCDVHLMIDNPLEYIDKYKDAGTDLLTFHYESVDKSKIIEIIKSIKKHGMRAGISIKPNTDIRVLDEYLPYLDYILIMSVEPGRGGQKFLESSLDKISYLNSLKSKYNYLIGVDGGINDITSKLVKESGCDVVIVGSYLANNLNEETIKCLR